MERAAVGADESVPIPLWLAFLARITNNDPELIAYLRRVCSYCMTGSTREHAMFFLYGRGAKGKSVFLNTIAGIFGDYHTTAPMKLFAAVAGNGTRKHRVRWKVPKHIKIHSE